MALLNFLAGARWQCCDEIREMSSTVRASNVGAVAVVARPTSSLNYSTYTYYLPICILSLYVKNYTCLSRIPYAQ